MRLRGFARRSFAPRTARRRRRRSCRRRAPGTRRARLSCRNFARAFARWNDEATPPPRLRAPTRRWCDSREARRSSSTTCRWRRRRRIVCTRIVCVCTAVCRCRMGGCSASGKIPGRSRRRRTRRCPEWKPRSPVASTSRTPRSGSARSPNSRRARNVARRSWRRRTRRFATPPIAPSWRRRNSSSFARSSVSWTTTTPTRNSARFDDWAKSSSRRNSRRRDPRARRPGRAFTRRTSSPSPRTARRTWARLKRR